MSRGPVVTRADRAVNREFGECVRDWRERRSLTQEQLGKWLGLHQQAVSRYELGRSSVSVALAVRIARALGITIAELCRHLGKES
jgi:transcriptional regulator with XRE-family HTH domain